MVRLWDFLISVTLSEASTRTKDAELQAKNAEIEKQKTTMKKKEEEFETLVLQAWLH